MNRNHRILLEYSISRLPRGGSIRNAKDGLLAHTRARVQSTLIFSLNSDLRYDIENILSPMQLRNYEKETKKGTAV